MPHPQKETVEATAFVLAKHAELIAHVRVWFHANIWQYHSVGNTDVHLYFNFEREVLKSMKVIAVLNELLNSMYAHTYACMHVHATWHRSRTFTQHAYSYWKGLNFEFIYSIDSENTRELISWEKKVENKKQS